MIVGANGFLGSEIVRHSMKLGWQVWGAYHRNNNNIPVGCQNVAISQLNEINIDLDMIFITAGNFTQDHEQLLNSNLMTPSLVSKKFRSAKLVFVSSIAVYGDHNGIIDEESSFNNPGIYGLSKIAGEFITTGHPNFSIIRLTNLYGKGMNARSFIPTIISDSLSKGTINLKNNTRVHDYLAVEDAASLCIKCGLNKNNDIYLGATGNSISNLEIAETIQKLVPGCKLDTLQPDDIASSYYFNLHRTKNKLCWEAEKTLLEELKSLVKFYESSNF